MLSAVHNCHGYFHKSCLSFLAWRERRRLTIHHVLSAGDAVRLSTLLARSFTIFFSSSPSRLLQILSFNYEKTSNEVSRRNTSSRRAIAQQNSSSSFSFFSFSLIDDLSLPFFDACVERLNTFSLSSSFPLPHTHTHASIVFSEIAVTMCAHVLLL